MASAISTPRLPCSFIRVRNGRSADISLATELRKVLATSPARLPFGRGCSVGTDGFTPCIMPVIGCTPVGQTRAPRLPALRAGQGCRSSGSSHAPLRWGVLVGHENVAHAAVQHTGACPPPSGGLLVRDGVSACLACDVDVCAAPRLGVFRWSRISASLPTGRDQLGSGSRQLATLGVERS